MTSHELDPETYQHLLEEVTATVRQSRRRVARVVANELLELYWRIGKAILDRQEAEGWGSKVISRLADDLRAAFPDMTGLSRSNLHYMRALAAAWPLHEVVPHAVGQLSWGHVRVLLDKLHVAQEREWYATAAVGRGWTRNALLNAIKADERGRSGSAPSSFGGVMSSAEAADAQLVTKDPYVLDYLGLRETYSERELEDALTHRIHRTLREFGPHLAYVGRQVHLEVGGDDFYVDLVFFHTEQLRFVIFELKTGRFQPEFLGKLSFYVAAWDGLKRNPDKHLPTVGVLLVADRDETVVRYSLAGAAQAVAVSSYALLPPTEQAAVPSEQQLEAALREGLGHA